MCIQCLGHISPLPPAPSDTLIRKSVRFYVRLDTAWERSLQQVSDLGYLGPQKGSEALSGS
jgi:hypothetical protein